VVKNKQEKYDKIADSTLPCGWAAYKCFTSGKTYYQNNTYKTTQWEKPVTEIPYEAFANLHEDWVPLIDSRIGKVYYQNDKEQKTQWEKPIKEIPIVDSLPKDSPDVDLSYSKSELEFIDTFTTPGQLREDESEIFENGECAVCFECLFENGPAVLTDKRKRVCRHFICKECARDLVVEKDFKCPLCRADFSDIKILPDIRKYPKEWFHVCNKDGTGHLNRQDLQDALTAILPIQQSQIIADLDLLWPVWDIKKNNKISHEKAMTTVIQYINRKVDLPKFQNGQIPDLTSIEQIAAWFDYFDKNGNAVLDKSEIARGLLKTFGSVMKKKNCRKLITNLLEVTWEATVGEDKSSLTAAEFAHQDGLAGIVHATFIHIKTFGDDSYESDEPLEPPGEDYEMPSPEKNEANPRVFSGHYLPRSITSSKDVGRVKQNYGQPEGLRSSMSMGCLEGYTPEQLAQMNNDKLATVLRSANLLKLPKVKRSKSS